MREIEFRGKDVKTNKWVHGNLNVNKRHGEVFISIDNDYDEDRCYDAWHKEAIFIKVIPETVGQCTGLLDKNGKKIYEGDIIESKSELFSNWGRTPTGRYDITHYEIIWIDECWGRKCIKSKSTVIGSTSKGIIKCCLEFYEIIGNIYDSKDKEAKP
jgi:uncharacterized phage protein (TIGR01671 family)